MSHQRAAALWKMYTNPAAVEAHHVHEYVPTQLDAPAAAYAQVSCLAQRDCIGLAGAVLALLMR